MRAPIAYRHHATKGEGIGRRVTGRFPCAASALPASTVAILATSMLLAFSACADEVDPAPSGGTSIAPSIARSETIGIRFKGSGTFGRDLDMSTDVFLPSGAPPFPVVVWSHGRPGGAAAGRARIKHTVPPAQVNYWIAKGFAIVAPVRPGYGATGGPDAEASGANFNEAGGCTSKPDYEKTATSGAHAIEVAVDWVRMQTRARPDRIILVGQSVGGLSTVAAAADHPPGVIGYVNFAGGSGGIPDRAPGHSCDPQQLTEMYAAFGKETTVPNLWIYALNDQYWGRDVPSAWHAAFAAGASPSTFVHAAPVADGDGHGLSRHESALWSHFLDTFLRSTASLDSNAPGTGERTSQQTTGQTTGQTSSERPSERAAVPN